MNTHEALEMVFGEDLGDDLDSGGELDIPEDPAFPLPPEESDSGDELYVPGDPTSSLASEHDSSDDTESGKHNSSDYRVQCVLNEHKIVYNV